MAASHEGYDSVKQSAKYQIKSERLNKSLRTNRMSKVYFVAGGLCRFTLLHIDRLARELSFTSVRCVGN
jgi:hypothetical protein